jgi:hypothetical protein
MVKFISSDLGWSDTIRGCSAHYGMLPTEAFTHHNFVAHFFGTSFFNIAKRKEPVRQPALGQKAFF